MKNLCLVFVFLILGGGCIFAQKSDSVILKVLKKKDAKVVWNAASRIEGDFDADGVADYALRGRKGKSFVLGIVKGSPHAKSKSWTLEFGEDSGDQGALCSVAKARIETENIDRDYKKFAADYLEDDYVKRLSGLPKGAKGISIYDGVCDGFHVFWDRKLSGFTWWRV